MAYLKLAPIPGAAEYWGDYDGKNKPVVWMRTPDGYDSIIETARTIDLARSKANKWQQKENSAVAKEKKKAEQRSFQSQTLISDLLDIVHMVIIKAEGENDIILKELKSIDDKIASGKLENYPVDNHPFFKTMLSKYK